MLTCTWKGIWKHKTHEILISFSLFLVYVLPEGEKDGTRKKRNLKQLSETCLVKGKSVSLFIFKLKNSKKIWEQNALLFRRCSYQWHVTKYEWMTSRIFQEIIWKHKCSLDPYKLQSDNGISSKYIAIINWNSLAVTSNTMIYVQGSMQCADDLYQTRVEQE